MGAVVLDAGVLIGFSNPSDAHHAAAVAQIRDASGRGHALRVPASALSEYLVVPARRSKASLAGALEIVRRLPVEVVTLNEHIAADAALLRAQHSALRLPDALVIATARVQRAELLVTTDRRWPSKRTLKLAGELVFL